ncbi:tyrosine phosphatase family-domain-containing protein [Blastocladiella britannica]|nr:tyrosine phosphatase family-domain-containing protein [Blastocladiella britannica]
MILSATAKAAGPRANNEDDNEAAITKKRALVPPFRFAFVEHGVYRGAYPRPRNLEYLSRLNLATVLSLTPDPLPAVTIEALTANGARCLHATTAKPKEDVLPVDPAAVLRLVVGLVLDPACHPLYIHCLDGQTVTGCIVLALRKLQGWTVASALAEYARCVRGDGVASEVAEYIGKLGGEVDLTTTGPGSGWRSHTVLAPIVASFASDPAAATASDQDTSIQQQQQVQQQHPPALVPLPRWFWGGTIPFRRHPHAAFKLRLPPLPPPATVAPSPADILFGLGAGITGIGGAQGTNAGTAVAITASSSSNSMLDTTSLGLSMPVGAVSSAAGILLGGTGGGAVGGGTGDTGSSSGPSDAARDFRARLLSDIMGTGASASSGGGGIGAGGAAGGGVTGLGIASVGGGIGGGGGTGGTGSHGMAGDSVAGGGGSVGDGTRNPDIDDAGDVGDDDDDEDDDNDDGEEVSLSRMVQALNLAGLRG